MCANFFCSLKCLIFCWLSQAGHKHAAVGNNECTTVKQHQLKCLGHTKNWGYYFSFASIRHSHNRKIFGAVLSRSISFYMRLWLLKASNTVHYAIINEYFGLTGEGKKSGMIKWMIRFEKWQQMPAQTQHFVGLRTMNFEAYETNMWINDTTKAPKYD